MSGRLVNASAAHPAHPASNQGPATDQATKGNLYIVFDEVDSLHV